MQQVLPERSIGLGRLGLALALAGGVTLLLGLILGAPVAQAYLFGYTFFLALTVGTLAVLLLHHLLRSQWGLALQPFLEASVSTLPLLALLALPLFLFLPELYPWARPTQVATDPILQHRQPYNNPIFFALRLVLYFALLIFLARRMTHWGQAEGAVAQRRTETAAWGLALLMVGGTFLAFDLLMGLEAHFFSASYGALFVVGHALGGLALAVALATRSPAVATWLSRRNLQNQANLLLALSIIWVYLALTTFIIVWGADLPHEAEYYLPRTQGFWGGVAVSLLLGQFFLPFLALLTNPPKREPRVLFYIAFWIVAFRLVDHAWTVLPSFQRAPSWADLAALLGVGGLWLLVFLRGLVRSFREKQSQGG